MYKHWFVQWITCNTDFLLFVHLGGFSFFCLLGLRRWWHQGGGVILSLYNADRESVSMWSIMTDIFLHDAGKIISILVSVSLLLGIFVVSNQNNYPSSFFNIVKKFSFSRCKSKNFTIYHLCLLLQWLSCNIMSKICTSPFSKLL